MILHHPYRHAFRKTRCSAARAAPQWLALAGILAFAAAPASADQLGPLKQITGPSPFAGCTADQVASQDGTNYPGSEIEPWIDSNPADHRNLIAAWQQDRWSNGGSRGDISAYTKNGGDTWHTVLVPNTTACTGGTFKRASDPWVSFSPNGTAYYFTLAFDPDLPNGAFGPNAVLVSRSTDGGQTWGNPITLISDPAGQVLNDKNSLTADPTNSRFAYAVWDRLRDFTLPTGPAAHAASPSAASMSAAARFGDGVVMARERARRLGSAAAGVAAAAARAQPSQAAEIFFEGPAYFSRTTNFGQTWETPKKIYDPGGNAQTINNLVVVPPSGAVLDFFTEILPNGGTRIGFVKSTNKGMTFGGPSYPTAIATLFGIVTPDSLEPVRDASILFDVAVDGRNGNLYLVWQDVRFNALDQVAFSMSTDGGNTWTLPVRINKTPPNSNQLRQQVFIPSIEVARNGTLVVTYYDFRFDTDNGKESADHWAIFCDPKHDDCWKPSNWGGERRLTAQSFDILQAPNAGGFFLGDYMGLVASNNIVYPAFGIVDGPGRTSVFTRPIFAGGP